MMNFARFELNFPEGFTLKDLQNYCQQNNEQEIFLEQKAGITKAVTQISIEEKK